MTMTVAVERSEFSDFSISEWQRLDSLGNLFDRALKTAYLQTVVLDKRKDDSLIRRVVLDAVVETGVSTAHVYGMDFRAESPRYRSLVDDLTDGYMRVVRNESARDKVRAVLPSGLSLSERNNRLDVFGLSGRDAVRLERMRQNGITGRRLEDARLAMQVQRGNLVTLTEINRIINQTVETVWIDNMTVAKAKRTEEGSEMLLQHAGKVTAITSLRGLPRHAKKQIVTRRDWRTCDYCWPLEGRTARIGTMFRTLYGLFPHPPFHPRCRCYMIVSY